MATFSESFEGGTLGAMVSRDNTTFWLVDYEDTDPQDNLTRFTDDAFAGGLAATVPPDVLIAARDLGGPNEVFHDMVWLGTSPDNKIIDEPVDISWYYKFESGLEPYFGRYIFELWFDSIGNDILTDHGGGWMYPDTDYRTHLFVGLEHSNLDPGDDLDSMYYYHSNFTGAHGPENDYPNDVEVIQPQFPRGTWLNCRFTWAGAGLPYTMKVTHADNESVVLMDLTLTAPAGIGFAYIAMNVIGTRVDGSAPGDEWVLGYDFQNWFDGFSVAPAIVGRPDASRRRFT